jgi:hypothetical protein
MTPGPYYYRLADGRQFFEYSRDELVPMCKGLGPWDIHCIISAAEHLFRMGAKEGEAETDLDAQDWWINRASNESLPLVLNVLMKVTQERKKVGR